MKKFFVFFTLVLFLFSCKKEYKCHCNTQHPRRGFVNDSDYTFKEKKKEDALAKCIQQYDESGLAVWGINCEIR